MKQFLFIVNAIVAIMFMAGCHHVPQTNLLAEAEAFLPAEPDSADVRLQMVDVQQLDGDDEEALYALLRTMTDVMQDKTISTDSLIGRAYNYYRQKSKDGTSPDNTFLKHFAQSALYMGDWYASIDSIKSSEDCYRQAIKASEKVQDWHTCYIAYSCLAEQANYGSAETALELMEKAVEVYGKCQDNARNLISLYGYAAAYSGQIAYEKETSFQQALDYAQRAYQLARDSCFSEYYDQTSVTLALIYWEKGDYQKALDYVRNIHLDELSSENSQNMNLRIAQFYLSCDSISKAKELYSAPKHIENKTFIYLYARGMSEVAVRQLVKDSILFYMDSAYAACEAMYLDALQVKDEYYQDNLEKEKKNERLIYKDKLKTLLFASIIAIILICSSLMGWALVLKLRISRQQRAQKEEEERHLREEMRLLEERQQALADSHQKKTAAIKYLQNYIIDRSNVTLKLKDGGTHVKMTPKEWMDVEQLLDEIDDQRISKIRKNYKNLSNEDIRLCIMVRIGMSNPAIGNVYSITPSAVQHRKLALKKTGFGEKNPNITLDDFIRSI